ncbi:EamA family transporter (plasmid) [Rhizobium acidisoli]|uniref:EamA family transporter n=1 Tax=Rhizobium acidisoli TaxID=1538158 RepID=A0AAE5WTB0_9HYPH|nr:EamA family transporter [Rhizobium acidisoli]KPH06195.1 permease [Rhizobium acidisoli]QAS82196.1 EamA family transporter [Rhizobium acidisoli]
MINQRAGKATAVGLIAIGLWSGLALFTVAAGGIPPFELLALCFGVAFASGRVVLVLGGAPSVGRLCRPPAASLLAFFAIFLYHALYFFALATVPPARASLIAYLWPLLIVLFSALVPGGDRLGYRHLVGAALGFIGAAIIFMDRQAETEQASNVLGYLAAFACAAIWSGYSVINRRFEEVPSQTLIGVYGAVALAGATAHLLFEDSVVPTVHQWLAVLFLGMGPTGLAFLAWDYATKHGNMPLLGTLSYLAPLISTLLLVASGQSQASIYVGLSALLIVGGAGLACYPGRAKENAKRPGT